jgi:hypothetical protein
MLEVPGEFLEVTGDWFRRHEAVPAVKLAVAVPV